MKHIVVISAGFNTEERECAEQLSSRMPNYKFLFFSPEDFKGPFRRFRFNRATRKAVSNSCLALVSPAAAAEHAQALPVRPLPCGVDFEAFNSSAERNLPFPDDLFNIKNPIIGHFGCLDGNANLQIIKKAAEAHPEWSFVFVGSVLTELSSLHSSSLNGIPGNVHVLGEKPRHHLPAYISRFDVCVNIANSSLASAENLYQYLASGKPVVSLPHPAQALDYADAIYLAGTPEEFISLCKKALGERDAWKVRRRVEYGRAASWDARAAELERTIKELSV
jgi:glycosyltransferase involved in cell wall biosynthesis